MTEIDRRTALLMALLGAVAPSAADAQAPAADTHHDMSMAPANWSHPDEVAMLGSPRMTALDLIGPQYMFASLMGARVHLVESMAKRCRFLGEVAQKLDLPVEIHNLRAEDLGIRVDIVTARACAPLPRLLGYAEPYLKRGATGLFLKGQDVAAELIDAAKYWKFEAELSASLSHPDGRILQVKGLSRVRTV